MSGIGRRPGITRPFATYRDREPRPPAGTKLQSNTSRPVLLTFDSMKHPARLDLLQGTLDLLILRTLQGDPMHGWAISERIHQISQDVLQVNQGSLYPALHRLEHQGWISAEWGVSELGRRARFYSLTASGQKQLEIEAENWGKLSEAIARVLRMA